MSSHIKCFEDFLVFVKGLKISIEDKKKKPFISVKWSTGGVGGGGGGGDQGESNYYGFSSDESPPEFDELDEILDNICPSLSFMRYKALCNEVVEFDSYTQNEYYGNSTNYSIKKCYLDKLYTVLLERDLI